MTSKNNKNNNSIHFNVCVVIGIVPPLDQKTKNELLLVSSLSSSSSSSNNDSEDDVVMIRWSSNDTKNLNRRRWIVPDQDTEENIPTMLLSAYLGRRRRCRDDSDSDFYDTNDDDETMISPEVFSLFIQNKLNNNNTTNNNNNNNSISRISNKIEYTCEVWASAPAPLPMMTYNDDEDNDDYDDNDCDYDEEEEEEDVEDRKSFDHERLLLQHDDDESSLIEEEELQLQQFQRYSKFRQKGLCLVSNILKKDYIQEMKILPLVQEAIVNAETAIRSNYPTIKIGEDSFLFSEIASRSKQRFDLLLSSTTNAKLYTIIRNGVFLNTNNGLLQLLKKLFYGDNNNDENNLDNNDNNNNDHEKKTTTTTALPPPVSITNLEDLDLEMDLSIVYSKPGANHQGWHADGNHLVGASDAGWDEDEDDNNNNDSNSNSNTNTNKKKLELPYAICIFIPLIDLNVTVGYTQFWLGSHKYKNLQGFGKFSEISNSTCDIGRTTKKGNGILYDYRLLHRGMPNTNFRTNDDAVDDDDDANEQQRDNTTATHSNRSSNSNDEDEVDDKQEQEQEQPPYYRPVLQLLCRRKFYKEKNNYGTKSIYDTDNDNDMQNK